MIQQWLAGAAVLSVFIMVVKSPEIVRRLLDLLPWEIRYKIEQVLGITILTIAAVLLAIFVPLAIGMLFWP